MAKKRKPPVFRRAKAPVFRRTDAERRLRQGERLSRLLRVLHCIMGPGRWDADALASELEVSPRTIHRIMQSLSMANVPWYFCKDEGCYRVRTGYRLPGVDGQETRSAFTNPASLKSAIDAFLKEITRTMDSLQRVSEELAKSVGKD